MSWFYQPLAEAAALQAAGGAATFSYIGSGGAQTGGAAALSKTKIAQVAGGASTGGAVAVSKQKVFPVAGGIASGGAATTTYAPGGTVYSYTTSGGIATGGAAALSKQKIPQVAGGLTGGGAATLSKQKLFAASGGATSGGIAALSKQKVAQIAGGASTNGAAVVSKQKVFPVAGGVTAAGAATASFLPAGSATTYSYAGTGGITMGGASATQLVSVPAEIAKGNGEPAQRVRDPDWNRLWRPPLAPRHYAGSGGISTGGTAAMHFEPGRSHQSRIEKRPVPAAPPVSAIAPPRATVYPFRANGGASTGGAAQIEHHDHRAYVQRIDAIDLDLAA